MIKLHSNPHGSWELIDAPTESWELIDAPNSNNIVTQFMNQYEGSRIGNRVLDPKIIKTMENRINENISVALDLETLLNTVVLEHAANLESISEAQNDYMVKINNGLDSNLKEDYF